MGPVAMAQIEPNHVDFIRKYPSSGFSGATYESDSGVGNSGLLGSHHKSPAKPSRPRCFSDLLQFLPCHGGSQSNSGKWSLTLKEVCTTCTSNPENKDTFLVENWAPAKSFLVVAFRSPYSTWQNSVCTCVYVYVIICT